MKRFSVILAIILISPFIVGCQLLNQEPVISVYDDFKLEYEVNTVNPDWKSAISIHDKEDGDIEVLGVEVNSDEVDMTTVGVYKVVYQVADSKGKIGKKVVNIEVVDTQKPVIELKGQSHVDLMIGYSYQEAGVIITDNYDSDLSDKLVIKQGGLDVDKVGTYYIRYSVEDSNGNESVEVTRTVKVFDDLSPLIDPSLESVIRTHLQKPTGKITKQDAESIQELSGMSQGIKSLVGIEYLTNLRYLNLSQNEITDLSPLKMLTNLIQVDLSYNQISDLKPLSGLKQLKTISVKSNTISDISPLSKVTSLNNIYASFNEITDISSLASLINLKDLWLDNNRIFDISVVKAIYLNGGFIHSESHIVVNNNPLDTSPGSHSYNTIIYFADRNLPLQHTSIIITDEYTEDHTSYEMLELGKEKRGFIGFRTDEDWYLFTLFNQRDIEILYPRNNVLDVRLYLLQNGELVELSFDKLETMSYFIIDETLGSGSYYLKVSVNANITTGSYTILVRNKLDM